MPSPIARETARGVSPGAVLQQTSYDVVAVGMPRKLSALRHQLLDDNRNLRCRQVFEDSLHDPASILVPRRPHDGSWARGQQLVYDELGGARPHRRYTLLQHVIRMWAPERLPRVRLQLVDKLETAAVVRHSVEGILYDPGPIRCLRQGPNASPQLGCIGAHRSGQRSTKR